MRRARRGVNGRTPRAASTRPSFADRLYTAGLPTLTSSSARAARCAISNFLLWQIAYAEIYVTPVLWPDFRARHFLEAIADFQKRERRYGGVLDDEQPLREDGPRPAAATR